MRFGDEAGILWLPAPGSVHTPKGKNATGRQPGGKAKVIRATGTLPESDWVAPTDYPRLSGLVGFDFETQDPLLKTNGPSWCFPGVGKVVGFSLAWDGGERYYPLYHEGGGNVEDPEKALAYLRDVAENPDVQFVCHNAPYELGWLKRLGIRPARVPFCTQVAAALLDEYRRYKGGYNLNAVGRDWCGMIKDETLLTQAAAALGLDPKKDLWRLPAKFVGPYGETDSANVRDIWFAMKSQLEEQNLMQVFDIECRYMVVITEQRWRGVRIDVDGAEQLIKRYSARELELQKRRKELVGFDAPVWNGADLAKAFRKRGIIVPGTVDAPSITQPWLKTLDDDYARALLEERRKNKTRTTFVEGMLRHVVDGRVHPIINAMPTDEGGAISGRASSEKPNEQNQPNKDKDPEAGKAVRGLWLPEEGCRWSACDYSQQEPRLAIHLAEKAEVPGARLAGDQLRSNPRTDFHKMVAELAHILRPQAKILNLALIYGKGEVATCRELGFPTEVVDWGKGPREVAGEEGKRFIAAYNAAVPYVQGLKDLVAKTVKRRGYVRTILNRRCRFGGFYKKDHAAVNRVVQGSAGDQLKKAQVDIYDQLGEVPLVAVHDEVGMNNESDAQIERVVECMVHTIELTVPVVVDVATGKNWGEAL